MAREGGGNCRPGNGGKLKKASRGRRLERVTAGETAGRHVKTEEIRYNTKKDRF